MPWNQARTAEEEQARRRAEESAVLEARSAEILLVLLGALAWLVIQSNEIECLREDNLSLASARDALVGAREALAKEKASLLQDVNAAERDRDLARCNEINARADLRRKIDAHAATRQQLSTVRQELDSARLVIRNPPQPAVAPQLAPQSAPPTNPQS
ncbi:hypothetical protein ACNJYD_08495 [Bradyrhizobium sp. DASA03005]|uniref:hypothetical protein n=1 Tax=Bradyrhizobium sp. SPXBL-02 TaxID=3395912 RepID=UPI003F71DA09